MLIFVSNFAAVSRVRGVKLLPEKASKLIIDPYENVRQTLSPPFALTRLELLSKKIGDTEGDKFCAQRVGSANEVPSRSRAYFHLQRFRSRPANAVIDRRRRTAVVAHDL